MKIEATINAPLTDIDFPCRGDLDGEIRAVIVRAIRKQNPSDPPLEPKVSVSTSAFKDDQATVKVNVSSVKDDSGWNAPYRAEITYGIEQATIEAVRRANPPRVAGLAPREFDGISVSLKGWAVPGETETTKGHYELRHPGDVRTGRKGNRKRGSDAANRLHSLPARVFDEDPGEFPRDVPLAAARLPEDVAEVPPNRPQDRSMSEQEAGVADPDTGQRDTPDGPKQTRSSTTSSAAHRNREGRGPAQKVDAGGETAAMSGQAKEPKRGFPLDNPSIEGGEGVVRKQEDVGKKSPDAKRAPEDEDERD